MKGIEHVFRIGLVALAALALTACGGGGGGTSGGSGGGGGGGGSQGPVAGTVFNTVALDGLSGSFSAGVAINNAATPEVVGFAEDSNQTVKAVSWTISGITPSTASELSPLAGNSYSAAYGINDSGLAVGESGAFADVNGLPVADRNTVAVAWTAGAVDATALSTSGLLAGGASAAYGINSSGRIVGEAAYNLGGDTVAVIWVSVGANPVVLPHLFSGGTPVSAAYFINNDGSIVGESRNADGRMQAVAWIPGSGGDYGPPVAMLGVANQAASVAFAIDLDGRVVGEAELQDGTVQGMVWNDDGSTVASLGSDTSAAAANNADWIVGYSSAASGSDRAAAWNASDVNDSQNLASAFSQAYSVNDQNQIVGISGTQAMVALPQ